jgi:signal transduction histidine kinase
VAVVERGVDDLLRRMATYIEREQSFTRDASHELRGPLSVIRSAAEQLAADAQLPATAQRRAAAIAASAARLADTVQALLMLARQAHPPGGASPLLPAIEACVLDLSLDGERAIEIAIDVPEGARVAIDSAVLDVLLRNIIGNALTHATGAVRIAVVQDRCEISNRSPAPLRESDFDAFAKGERSAGVGLGLNIVKRLDERYRLGLRFRYDPAEQTVVVAIPLLPAG